MKLGGHFINIFGLKANWWDQLPLSRCPMMLCLASILGEVRNLGKQTLNFRVLNPILLSLLSLSSVCRERLSACKLQFLQQSGCLWGGWTKSSSEEEVWKKNRMWISELRNDCLHPLQSRGCWPLVAWDSQDAGVLRGWQDLGSGPYIFTRVQQVLLATELPTSLALESLS